MRTPDDKLQHIVDKAREIFSYLVRVCILFVEHCDGNFLWDLGGERKDGHKFAKIARF